MKKIQRGELIATLDRIVSIPILVTGDLILDRYIWGKVDRISPEAPVPVVEVTKSDDRLGGAGNVVRNLRAIGAAVEVSGIIGDDGDGQSLLSLLSEIGAGHSGVIIDSTRPTVLKTRVIAQTQQIVRIDREERGEGPSHVSQGLASLLEKSIDQHRAVIVSDYGKGAVSQAVLDRLHEAKEQGRLGLASRPLFVDPHPRNYDRYRCMSVAKPNRKEAEVASGVSISSTRDAFAAADILSKRWNAEMMVVTLGEDGMIVKMAETTEGIHLKTAAKEVFDVSGAGDTVTALFCAALAAGASPTVAGILSNIAAGIVVSEVGTVAIDPAALRSEIARWEAD
jgi:D-beta-D-heptose 7-phosphate kinase/D-beta-D-heptose 1-phosphate adenosyltransferase